MIPDNNHKIIIAHPLQQHSYRTAQALKKANLLHSYLTTVYYQKGNLIYRILSKILGKDNTKRMKGRSCAIFDKCVKKYYEIFGIIYLFVIRYDSKKIIEPLMYKLLTASFGKMVEKYCRNKNVQAIIMYDTTAGSCFSKLKKTRPDVVRILDMSSASAPFIRSIIKNEIKKNNAFNSSLITKLKSYSVNKCVAYTEEIENSDFFLVASSFVGNSLLSCGVKKDKIVYVPYGVDNSIFLLKNYNLKVQGSSLKFLFVGRVEAAKGVYYLFEAFKQLKYLNIELTVVGPIECCDNLLLNYRGNIKFLGLKNKSEMSNIYQDSDVYIMPSLYEGFSLTLFEAMASGLPVIASKNTGADGIIIDYEHGFVIEACSVEAIKDKVIWFYNNQDQIKTLGVNARILSERFSWDFYEKNVVSAVIDAINNH